VLDMLMTGKESARDVTQPSRFYCNFCALHICYIWWHQI